MTTTTFADYGGEHVILGWDFIDRGSAEDPFPYLSIRHTCPQHDRDIDDTRGFLVQSNVEARCPVCDVEFDDR